MEQSFFVCIFENMLLYDSHTHHNHLEDVLAIENWILKANEPVSLNKDKLYSIGFHPWFIQDGLSEDLFETLENLIHLPNVKAIGECGLDKSIALDFGIQELWFKKQIELSEKFGLPLIIHSVRAYSELLAIKKQLKVQQKWIFHGFNSSWSMAQQSIISSCFLSFGANILKKSDKLNKVLVNCPSEFLLIESDEKPERLLEIYRYIAALRKIDLDELIFIQKSNFTNVYNIQK